jgi:hypothetical protein
MLCNRCFKKIPEGEEIKKPKMSGFFRASWEGYGSEIVCRSCAIKDKKRNKSYWMLFIFFSIAWLIGFLSDYERKIVKLLENNAKDLHAPVIQWTEYSFPKQVVGGSNPSRSAIKK